MNRTFSYKQSPPDVERAEMYPLPVSVPRPAVMHFAQMTCPILISVPAEYLFFHSSILHYFAFSYL